MGFRIYKEGEEYMTEVMTYLRELNTASIILRLFLAALFAGIIGIERGQKRRPAGFRTHMLVCMGATLVMITNQYMVQVLGMDTDPSRLGAQVISGIGFLGAGTIIVVGRNQVKGLTTAAGLWACACMGLAIGIGFYEGAIISCVFLFAVMTGLHNVDTYLQLNSKIIEVYVELETMSSLTNLLDYLKQNGTKVSNLEIQRIKKGDYQEVGCIMTLKLPEKHNHEEYLVSINKIDGIRCIEEIG